MLFADGSSVTQETAPPALAQVALDLDLTSTFSKVVLDLAAAIPNLDPSRVCFYQTNPWVTHLASFHTLNTPTFLALPGRITDLRIPSSRIFIRDREYSFFILVCFSFSNSPETPGKRHISTAPRTDLICPLSRSSRGVITLPPSRRDQSSSSSTNSRSVS